MIGKYNHTIDAKGRLFIPAQLRKELGDLFFATVSPEKCLTIYTLERWEASMEKLKTMSQTAQMKLRPIFSLASKCEPDAQGRIQLTQILRERAELTKDVTIIGTGLYVQIWDSERYKAVEEEESSPENIKSVIEKYDF